jgi:FtsH-binding integral membrane protein
MAFDRQLLISIVGSVLVTSLLAWQFGWGWGLALATAAFLIVFEIARRRNSHRLRNWYLLRRRRPPDENSLAFRASAESAIVLWLMEIGSLGFVAAAIFILVSTPEHWLTALAGIGFFGLCAAFNTYLLVLRRRGAPP